MTHKVPQLPLIPANAGTQIQPRHSGLNSKGGARNWVPAFAGMSG
jgi:hypothetical protein